MSVFIIRPGERVVCIDARLPGTTTMLHRLCKDRLEEGSVYLVDAVVWLRGEKGLHIAGKDHTPTDGWRACRFRKLLENEAEKATPGNSKLRSEEDQPGLDPVMA